MQCLKVPIVDKHNRKLKELKGIMQQFVSEKKHKRNDNLCKEKSDGGRKWEN